VTLDNLNQCQCNLVKDILGNELRQCNCPLPVAVQFNQDQECSCQRVTDLIKNTTTLQCSNSCNALTPGKAAVFPESQCKCVTSFDSTTNGTYQQCVCKNVPQCVDPKSIAQPDTKQAAAPCKITYPCSCASTASGNLSCQCTNPQSKLVTPITQDAKQCQCEV